MSIPLELSRSVDSSRGGVADGAGAGGVGLPRKSARAESARWAAAVGQPGATGAPDSSEREASTCSSCDNITNRRK